MKRDFNAPLTFAGKPIEENKAVLTLGGVSVNALLVMPDNEPNLQAEEKFKRYKLAERLSAGGVQDLSVDELALVKRLVGNMYQPIIVGASFDLFERELPPEPVEDKAADTTEQPNAADPAPVSYQA
ncbi:hypothetical protein [Dyella mobilis]|uniref:Phage tail assembly chaperone protein, E, or 41 or 14 n=1 Tax=Dyella mobilis TaxID=1849582 RepID=A0ABS2KKA0_9GAMM|nr:hypothetical protein [Dyella mobilis]MBM7131566.1 hypothetical protein [Dyella mobilis]GLQ96462.1 hypothetical protein GCM10007863_08800 [Dyella mobilis]